MEHGTLHFVGIGGIGMSAIARVLLARGERVSGSDAHDSALLDALRADGAQVFVGHAAAHVDEARTVIVSSAIAADNPECRAALERDLPILRRGEMLARLVNGRAGIAICGTHGKTTTTAMTASVLRAGGIDASLVLGGIEIETGTNAHDGTADWFLTEADESDGSFALLAPKIAVLTNVENDHLVSDEQVAELVDAFERFLEKLPPEGCAVVGVDSPNGAWLATRARQAATVSVGFSGAAFLRPANLRFASLGATFDVFAGERVLGRVELGVPGEINVQNALAALAVGRALGVPFERIAAGLRAFRGVRRRFEILAHTPRMTIVDDYAHHPTALRATIAAARRFHAGPLVVAFQPHRYTRTAYLAREFAASLQEADVVYLAPVYSASETPIDGVSERSIGEPLRAAGADVRYVADVRELPELSLIHI